MKKSQRQARKKFEKTQLIITIICLFLAIICLVYVIIIQYKKWHNEQVYEQLREVERTELVTEILELEEPTEESTIYCQPLYDFAELHQENEDIYAWIIVPGTQVDYPVLQSEVDNYYLDYNVDGSKGYPGCIYTNKCNKQDFSDYNTVFYGHNMGNGTMFGCLHSFEDQTFFDENDSIVIYTETARLTYQIYAAVKFNDQYIPTYYDVTTWEGTQSFLLALEEYMDEEESHKRDGVEITAEDRLITLSTCVKNERSRRYLIIGKLVEEAFYE
jgi:sortase B